MEPEIEKDDWKTELRRVAEKKVDEPTESVKEQIAKGKMDDPDAKFIELKRNLVSFFICFGYVISFTICIIGSLEELPLWDRIIFLVVFIITNNAVHRMGWLGAIIDHYKNREKYKTKAEETLFEMIVAFLSHSFAFLIVVTIANHGRWTLEGFFIVSVFVTSALLHVWHYTPLMKRIIKA